jgi:hypothetical protein
MHASTLHANALDVQQSDSLCDMALPQHVNTLAYPECNHTTHWLCSVQIDKERQDRLAAVHESTADGMQAPTMPASLFNTIVSILQSKNTSSRVLWIAATLVWATAKSSLARAAFTSAGLIPVLYRLTEQLVDAAVAAAAEPSSTRSTPTATDVNGVVTLEVNSTNKDVIDFKAVPASTADASLPKGQPLSPVAQAKVQGARSPKHLLQENLETGEAHDTLVATVGTLAIFVADVSARAALLEHSHATSKQTSFLRALFKLACMYVADVDALPSDVPQATLGTKGEMVVDEQMAAQQPALESADKTVDNRTKNVDQSSTDQGETSGLVESDAVGLSPVRMSDNIVFPHEEAGSGLTAHVGTPAAVTVADAKMLESQVVSKNDRIQREKEGVTCLGQRQRWLAAAVLCTLLCRQASARALCVRCSSAAALVEMLSSPCKVVRAHGLACIAAFGAQQGNHGAAERDSFAAATDVVQIAEMLLEWLMQLSGSNVAWHRGADCDPSMADMASLPVHLTAPMHVEILPECSMRGLTAAALHATVSMVLGRKCAEGAFGLVAKLVQAACKCMRIGVAANETLEVCCKQR